MSWRGTSGGLAAARADHDVVMTPGDYTYFDHYQSRNVAAEPLAIGGFLPLDSVYAYEPVPVGLEPQFVRHVLGAQGQVWTEYIPDPKAVEYMAFPRAARARRGVVDARAPGATSPTSTRDSATSSRASRRSTWRTADRSRLGPHLDGVAAPRAPPLSLNDDQIARRRPEFRPSAIANGPRNDVPSRSATLTSSRLCRETI